MKHLLALIFISLSFSAAIAETKGPAQLLQYTETLSRDHFYLHFDGKSQYRKQNIIGGEQQTAYHILGFEGDVFEVTVKSVEGETHYSISGEGFKQRSNSNKQNSETITVSYQDHEQPSTWVTIWVSAHPFAEYIIRVDKL
ncbi:MAG: hypothetical protein GY951_08425 [Psychromonas sp.]|nr:hypothetical protein [Psychromonas sp.]